MKVGSVSKRLECIYFLSSVLILLLQVSTSVTYQSYGELHVNKFHINKDRIFPNTNMRNLKCLLYYSWEFFSGNKLMMS